MVKQFPPACQIYINPQIIPACQKVNAVIIAVTIKTATAQNLTLEFAPIIGARLGNHRRIKMGYAPMKQPKPIKPPKRK
jgi:hypothetical protein